MKEKEDLMKIVNKLLKHQCDYCCWYYEPRGCECPFNMRDRACEKARKEQERDKEYLMRKLNYGKK